MKILILNLLVIDNCASLISFSLENRNPEKELDSVSSKE
jgi:hypothetical protein